MPKITEIIFYYTTYNDFCYSNKPYAKYVGQCVSYHVYKIA